MNGPGDPLEDEWWPGGSQSEGKPTVSEEEPINGRGV